VVPAGGLDEVVVDERLMKQLKEIVQFEKARYVTTMRWYMFDVSLGTGRYCLDNGDLVRG